MILIQFVAESHPAANCGILSSRFRCDTVRRLHQPGSTSWSNVENRRLPRRTTSEDTKTAACNEAPKPDDNRPPAACPRGPQRLLDRRPKEDGLRQCAGGAEVR